MSFWINSVILTRRLKDCVHFFNFRRWGQMTPALKMTAEREWSWKFLAVRSQCRQIYLWTLWLVAERACSVWTRRALWAKLVWIRMGLGYATTHCGREQRLLTDYRRMSCRVGSFSTQKASNKRSRWFRNMAVLALAIVFWVIVRWSSRPAVLRFNPCSGPGLTLSHLLTAAQVLCIHQWSTMVCLPASPRNFWVKFRYGYWGWKCRLGPGPAPSAMLWISVRISG